MAHERGRARRSWRVGIVTSASGGLPPTPSMQPLHKLRPVFPQHMASIGGYRSHRRFCSCCCVCGSGSGEREKKPARHSLTNLILSNQAGWQTPGRLFMRVAKKPLIVRFLALHWQEGRRPRPLPNLCACVSTPAAVPTMTAVYHSVGCKDEE